MSIARFIRSVWHTPPKQLLHRLALLFKRKSLVLAAVQWPALARPRQVQLATRQGKLPLPLWAPPVVSAVAEEPTGWRFDFLNEVKCFHGRIDWHRADLNTGTRLWKLNLHYFDWSDTLTDAQFAAVVSDWIDRNRPYGPGYWLDSWNSYAMSIRVVTWMGELARRRAGLTGEFIARAEAATAEQLRFLHSNLERDIGGNHLIKNIKALYWGARYFDGREAQAWAATADRLLAAEIKAQVLNDGFHFELSPGYHCQVFADLLDAWRLMPESALRARVGVVLHSMAQVVADLTHPDGMTSLFNDGGLRMAHLPGTLLAAYERLSGVQPTPRPDASFPDAGYRVFRRNEVMLVHDAGAVGPDGLPAHSHGDIFAFEMSLGGKRLFVDAGVYEYNPGERRARSRSTVAHNTMTLNDQDQCEFWSAFRMGRRARVRLHSVSHEHSAMVVDAEHDGYSHLAGYPRHRRRIHCLASGELEVVDTVLGGSGQRATSRLLLHPDVQVEAHDKSTLTLRTGDRRLRLKTDGGEIQVRPAVWWPDFGSELPTLQIVIELGRAPGTWSFHLSPIAA
jgi:uncharacterized heparinase superfamily protein